MNVNALILFLVLLGGLLALTIFFYGGEVVLHFLEKPDSTQALGSGRPQTQISAEPAASDAVSAADRIAADRFDDDGGKDRYDVARVAR